MSEQPGREPDEPDDSVESARPSRPGAPGAERDEFDRQQSERDASAAWSVPAYLLSGMAMYGAGGWLLDRWLGTSWLVLVGVLVGTALAMYLIWLRYGTR